MKKLLLPLLVSGLLTNAVHAEESSFKGRLVDQSGEAVANAEIYIRSLDRKVTTDENGSFTFDSLEEGRYVLDIEAGHDGHINRSLIHDGNTRTITIDHNDVTRMVITGNPLEHSMLDMARPSTIIAGDELVKNRGANVGETLSEEPGINLSSFGSGAGRPVIRGQQGNRVKVLSNNSSLQDAANSSPDHWISAEPLLAERVEVLKGPATLLYGGSAIGGAVNVVDKKIPNHRLDTVEGGFESRVSDSTTGEFTAVGTLTAGHNDWAMHIEAFSTHSDDITIPGFAESERLHALHEAEEEHHDNDEDHDEHEDHEEAYGLLENSAVKASGGAVGYNYFTENGSSIGFSYAEYERSYGIPVHAHGEEEHEGEHDDHDENHDEHEEDVHLELKQQRFDFKGEWTAPWKGIERSKFLFSRTSYEHTEFEGMDVGTVYSNDAHEARAEFVHETIDGWHGAFGLQYNYSDFQAIGDESFIPRSKTSNLGIFVLEEREFDNWHLELGARVDEQTIESPNGMFGKQRDIGVSAAAGAVWRMSDNWSLPINYSFAQRLPSAEELYSNFGNDEHDYVPHLATFTIEVGNPHLKEEEANNFDIGVRYNTDTMSFTFNVFHNKVDNYIFLGEEHHEEEGHDEHEEHEGEFPVYFYSQQDATFEGAELQMDWNFAQSGDSSWNWMLFADYTHAELNTGDYIPRIPASRFGSAISYQYSDWNFDIKAIEVDKQHKVAEGELATDGYTLLNASVSYNWYLDNADVLFFVRGNNLLDEEIRDHASFIKDYAPRAGRSVSAGFRVTF